MAPGVMISKIKSPFPPLLYQDTFSMSGPGIHPTFPTLYPRKRSSRFPPEMSRLLQSFAEASTHLRLTKPKTEMQMVPGVMISRIKSPFPLLLNQDTFSMSGPGIHPTFPTLHHRKRSLRFPPEMSLLLHSSVEISTRLQ